MLGRFVQFTAYVKYLFKAKSRHGVHSPFVFNFIENVILGTGNDPALEDIETLRKISLDNPGFITQDDLGAGSAADSASRRTIGQIARNASLPRVHAQMLYRLAAHFKPSQIIELGTSLGFTTAYLATAVRGSGMVYSIEGAPSVSAIAAENIKRLGLNNVELLRGEFSNILPGLCRTIQRVDLAFIDGNHRKIPTLEYFEILMKIAHEGTILVFDDIHWSAEMEEAWEKIIADPGVTLSIDLYRLGLVFMLKGMTKQHFILKSPQGF